MSLAASDIWNFIVSFAIAALSGLGIGSGGLLVIWLTEIMSFSAIRARSVNLLFFLLSASSALLVHARSRKLNYHLIFFCAAFGILGTVVGTHLGSVASPELIRRLFGGMLLGSGIYSLLKKPSGRKTLSYAEQKKS